MPSRNIVKIDIDDTYYHIYNRGVNKRVIFKQDLDYQVFFSLLKRHLATLIQKDANGREYPNYSQDIELLAVCLMPNHFHLLCYQYQQGAMTRLLRSVCTAYTMYFNKKYKRVGHLFQDKFKASMIDNDAYLQHITRYIHLNSLAAKDYSSLPYYLGDRQADWIKPGKILALFGSTQEYRQFLKDQNGYEDSLQIVQDTIGKL